MATISIAWSNLALTPDADGTTDVKARGTATLTCSASPATQQLGVALWVGCTYYDASDNPLDYDGLPLPSGKVWSKKETIHVPGASFGGSPLWQEPTKTHAGATWCATGKPTNAVRALYQYWAEASANGVPPCTCSKASVSSPGEWRGVTF